MRRLQRASAGSLQNLLHEGSNIYSRTAGGNGIWKGLEGAGLTIDTRDRHVRAWCHAETIPIEYAGTLPRDEPGVIEAKRWRKHVGGRSI